MDKRLEHRQRRKLCCPTVARGGRLASDEIGILRAVTRAGTAWLIAFAALLPFALAGPASAQEEGVHVDPDSPAGKEYEIPVEGARRDYSGKRSSDRGSSRVRGARRTASLFGAGISPRGGSTDRVDNGGGGADSTGRGNEAGEGRGASGAAGSSDDGGPSAPDRARGVATAASVDEGGAPLTMGGIVLAVVILGGALGLALRRRALRRGGA